MLAQGPKAFGPGLAGRGECLEGSCFRPLPGPSHDRAENLGATQRCATGGSRERLHVWVTQAVFARSDQTKTLQVVGPSGDVRGSRLPTYAESGKPNVPITRVLLRTIKSGSPPGAGRAHPQFVICHSSPAGRFVCATPTAPVYSRFAANSTLFRTQHHRRVDACGTDGGQQTSGEGNGR